MRSFVALLMLSLSLPALGSSFEQEALGFAVDFPKGRVTTSAIPMPRGYIGRVFQVTEGPAERFGVRVVRYPDGQQIEKPTEERRAYIDKVRDELVAKLKGTVVLERAVRLGDHAGRELTVRTTNFKDFVGLAVLYTQRVFLVGDRYFSVFTLSRFPGPKQQRFLDSFRLLDDPGAPDKIRFDAGWQRHDDGMSYFVRLPAEHLREGPAAKSRAVELSEEVSGLALARAWGMVDSPLLYGVSTLRLTDGEVTASSAEGLLNAMRLSALEELQLDAEGATAEVQVAVISPTRRTLSINGTRADKTAVQAQVHLTPDGFFEVVVIGPASAMARPEVSAFFRRFRPARAQRD